MRHILLPGAIPPHPLGMGQTTAIAGLVASAGLSYGLASHRLGAVTGAINLVSVTGAADDCLFAAACAQIQATYRIHQLSPSSHRHEFQDIPPMWKTVRASFAARFTRFL